MGITESKQVAQAIYVACTEAEKRGSNSIEPVLTDNFLGLLHGLWSKLPDTAKQKFEPRNENAQIQIAPHHENAQRQITPRQENAQIQIAPQHENTITASPSMTARRKSVDNRHEGKRLPKKQKNNDSGGGLLLYVLKNASVWKRNPLSFFNERGSKLDLESSPLDGMSDYMTTLGNRMGIDQVRQRLLKVMHFRLSKWHVWNESTQDGRKRKRGQWALEGKKFDNVCRTLGCATTSESQDRYFHLGNLFYSLLGINDTFVFRKIPIDADPESPHLKELRQCRLVTRESQKVIDELADSIFNAIWESCNRVSYALPPPISQSPRPFDQNLDDQAPSDSFPVSTTEPPLPFNPGFAQGFDQNFLDFSDQNLNIVGLNQPLAETFVPGHAQGFYWAPFPDYNTNIDDLDLLHRLFEEHHRSDPERGHQDHTQSCNQAFRLTPLEVASGSSGCESRQSNFTAESEGQAYAGPLLANDVSYSPDLEEYRIHRAAKHPQETTQGPDNLTDGQIRGISPIQVTPESGIAAC
ncbi:hypothetical protein HAV15_011266 [Penicillium sp. str. |nr:hypothetical protein HAV15_011266 [Penicillium sp. str. \